MIVERDVADLFRLGERGGRVMGRADRDDVPETGIGGEDARHIVFGGDEKVTLEFLEKHGL